MNMKNKSSKGIRIRMLMVGVLITVVVGCNRYTKHEVLTFFFTGVPTPEEEQKAEAEKAKALQAAAAAAAQKDIPKPERFSHPLWTAGRCDQCHQTLTNFSVPGVKKKSPGVFQKGMEPPGPLVVPRQELCIRCHKDKSAANAQKEGLWLHNTPAKGECHKCHDPHQSDQRYLLLEPPRQICIPCHKDPKIMELAAHKEPGECLTCHNPHFGKDKKMLKKDYQEIEHRLRLSPDLPGAKAPPGGLPKRGSSSQE